MGEEASDLSAQHSAIDLMQCTCRIEDSFERD